MHVGFDLLVNALYVHVLVFCSYTVLEFVYFHVSIGEFGIVFRASVAGWGEFTSPVTVAAKTLKG